MFARGWEREVPCIVSASERRETRKAHIPGGNMKSNPSVSIAAVVFFAMSAIPVQLAAQHHHYKLIDMGTFGGPESAVNGDLDTNNKAANNRGVTVGFSATSTPKGPYSHPFICGGDNAVGSFI